MKAFKNIMKLLFYNIFMDKTKNYADI